jgi:hypothetical protein
MPLKIDVKNTVIVNGKEYGSVEEIPAEVREAFEKAVAGSQGSGRGEITLSLPGPITFNDRVYRNEAAMPPDVRDMYRGVMKAIGTSKLTGTGRSGFRISLKRENDREDHPAPGAELVTPGFFSPSMRKILFGAGILLMLMEFFIRYFSDK